MLLVPRHVFLQLLLDSEAPWSSLMEYSVCIVDMVSSALIDMTGAVSLCMLDSEFMKHGGLATRCGGAFTLFQSSCCWFIISATALLRLQ